MAAPRSKVLSLYKSLLREGGKFTSYNYRHYAVRRIRDAFRESKTVTDPNEIQKLVAFGQENLEIIKRQVVIGSLYSTPPLVIEENAAADIEDLNRTVVR